MVTKKLNDGKFIINDNGVFETPDTAYESLVITDEHIPNKKYVDDAVATANEFSELTDVTGAYTTANALYKANSALDGLEETTTLLTEPAANQIQLVRGTSTFFLQADLTIESDSAINQDLTTDATPTFDLLTLNDPPVAAGDATRKDYVDGLVTGDFWDDVAVASTGDVDISTELENGDTIDGYNLVTGDRVLLKDQADATENGLYVAVASGAASRATDADAASEIENTKCIPLNGTAGANKLFYCTTSSIVLGVTNINFAELAGTSAHNSLSGLQGGAAADYYHFTSAQHTDLTDAGDSALHYHSTDRARANHTGTQLASTISDFDTEVSNNTDVTANTAARHVAVTLAGNDYLTLSGQEITANLIDLTSDVSGLLPVTNGGTGRGTATAYSVLCGGTTATGVQQSVASVGTLGQVLTSNGVGALPTFQDSGGGSFWSRDIGNGYTYLTNATDSVGVNTSTPKSKCDIIGSSIGAGTSDSTLRLSHGTDGFGGSAIEFGYGAEPNHYEGTRIRGEIAGGGGGNIYFESATNGLSGYNITIATMLKAGLFGVGTTTPRTRIDSLSITGPQFRATYADNAIYTDFTTDSTGVLNIAPSKSAVEIQSNGVPVYAPFSGTELIMDTNVGTAKSIFASYNVSGPWVFFGNNMKAGTTAFSKIDSSYDGWGFVLDARPAYSNFKLVYAGTGGVNSVGKLYSTANGSLLAGNDCGIGFTPSKADTLYFNGATGYLGVNTLGNIRRRFESRDTSGAQVRLTHTDNTAIVDLTADSLARFIVDPISGSIHIPETTTPTAKADYGGIYTKSDNKLYFQSGDGVEHEVAFV